MSGTAITPWYAANERANAAHRAWLDYRRAVREGVGIAAARMALLAAMRAYEEAT